MENNELKVIVLDLKNEMYNIDNVQYIRIQSKDYNLLILKNYMPVIGEIEGKVTIEAEKGCTFDKIKGFYSLSHNVCHLIIKER